MTLAFHPVADIFPMMTSDEFAALKADIADSKQREPIWLHPDGSILDGRNRYLACRDIGLKPITETYTGPLDKASLVQFVVSLNLKRRHLDSGQRAFVAVEIEKVLAQAAKERMIAAQNNDAGRAASQRIEQLPQTNGKAAAQAATIVGTNRQYVIDAKRITEQAPDLALAVKSGDMKITEARRQLQRRTMIQKIPDLPQDKFRVIYSDPPWQYAGTHPDYYGPAERHYPTMSLDELCTLDVRSLAADDAVLFLWATSPLIEQAFTVAHAWGFTYKAMFVWDKVKHNFGHYNSVRHELLLLCTKGSCVPDEQKLFDSVQSIERTEHSTKPEEFRHIIETLYTHGRRIELFARRQTPGWEVWGNEPR